MVELFEELKLLGYRITSQRKAVVRILSEARRSLSPEEIHTRAQDHCDTLGLVTVYRTLALLSDFGYVRRIHLAEGCHGYARSELFHGHHLICRNCSQTVEFHGSEELNPLMERISQRTGFIIKDHLLELLGICPSCQEQVDT